MERRTDAHTLAVGGLRHQADLLAFVSAVEAEPQIAGVTLIRVDGAIGVFRVLAASRDDVVEACRNARGFAVVIDTAYAGWDVLEVTATRDDTAARAPSTPPVSGGPRVGTRSRPPLLSDDVTRPRTRLRVFGRRPQEDQRPLGGSLDDRADDSAAAEILDPEVPPAPGPSRPPWSAALEDAIDVVLTTAPPPAPSSGRAWPPPVEVDVFLPDATVAAVDRERTTLIASPLRSFEQVNAFRDRLAALEGVLALTVGRFYHGALEVTVDYADPVPLSDRLRDLREFAPVRLRESRMGTIEITLPV